jgi:hypothetical protein
MHYNVERGDDDEFTISTLREDGSLRIHCSRYESSFTLISDHWDFDLAPEGVAAVAARLGLDAATLDREALAAALFDHLDTVLGHLDATRAWVAASGLPFHATYEDAARAIINDDNHGLSDWELFV